MKRSRIWLQDLWRQRRALRRYIKGRVWCLTWHSPVIRELGGYGGLDHLGRRRKSYHSIWCVTCGNRWEQADKGEPCRAALMWHTRESEKRAIAATS